MGGALLAVPQGQGGLRSYKIEPDLKNEKHVLTLFEDGDAMGGGSFQWAVDEYGFDAGYQAAIDQGEAWL